MKRFKNAAENIKKNLSTSTTSSIEIESVFDGKDYNSSITRAKFEQICSPIFDKCINLIKQVLDDTNTKIQDINEIVLVGGTTRIPKLQSIISEYFPGMISRISGIGIFGIETKVKALHKKAYQKALIRIQVIFPIYKLVCLKSLFKILVF